MKRLQDLERFEGDFSSMWRLDDRKPIFRLTWDWWWWLVMLDDEEGRPSGKQFMILWSTKDNDIVDVNSQEWRPSARPGADENGSLTLDGMVCAWWFDGEKMHDEIISEKCKLVAITDQNPIWPDKVSKTLGGGAVIPILPEDNSMGLNSDLSEFWIKAKSYRNKLDDTPESFEFKITPWNRAMSTARYATADYAAGMGYDILRLHGSKVHALIDGKESKGTAYFQKVKVQAPAIPWYWGMLHFSDGSYLDWFVPHISPLLLAKTPTSWKYGDQVHFSISMGALFHDAVEQRSEKFNQVSVRKEMSEKTIIRHGKEEALPIFHVEIKNPRTKILIEAHAVERAHWFFDQPTRGGIRSHLTYNEYPLEIKKINIQNEYRVRTVDDYEWIRGNAEHSWGLLH